MKILTVIFSITILFNYSYGDDNFDFKKTKWGMSALTVKMIEAEDKDWEFVRHRFENAFGGSVLTYRGQIFDSKCLLVYQFDQYDRLVCASYEFYDDNKEDNKAVYAAIEEGLASEYGRYDEVTDTSVGWISSDDRTLIELSYNEGDISLTYLIRSEHRKNLGSSLNEVNQLNFKNVKPAVLDDYDFRQVRWGMTAYQVKATETENRKDWEFVHHSPDLVLGGDVITYRGKLFGNRCLLIYHLENDGLRSASYSFSDLSDLELKYAYTSAIKVLTELHGKGQPRGKVGVGWTSKDGRTVINLDVNQSRGINIIYISLEHFKRNSKSPSVDPRDF